MIVLLNRDGTRMILFKYWHNIVNYCAEDLTGQVSVSQKGSLRQYDAKSTDGSLIPNEETVIIKDVVGTVLMVEPAVYSVSDEE